jgi:hypothetical protein
MKKRILIAALILVGITASSFAAKIPEITDRVQVSFNREFVNAQDVKWEKHENFIKASFSMNNMVLSAYFSADGNLIAVSRFISTNQLPIQLSASLKKDYSGYWVSDLFEIHDDNGTNYYITLENGSEKRVLTSFNANDWSLYKIENKQY